MKTIQAIGRLRNICVVKATTLAGAVFAVLLAFTGAQPALATSFTQTVPGTGILLPNDYPEAGGVAIVMVGVNGNVYFQFSDPANAFRGFNNRPNRPELGGNPFTINDPIALDCGFSSCRDYFGGGLSNLFIRFSAFDGDTQPAAEQSQGFDFNDISLLINGFNVGNWSDITTEITNNSGTSSAGFRQGFGNNTFNTGWFQSTNQGLLENLLNTGLSTTQVLDDDPNDNFWDFQRGSSLSNPDIQTVAPGYTIEKTASTATFTAVGQQITYTYIVENIGSVPITNIQIQDDQINAQGGSVSCDQTTLQSRSEGDVRGPDSATCTGVYTTTQVDVDAGQVVNVAQASGTPSEGQLGAVSDTATVTGPTQTPDIDLQKTSTLSNFGAAGTNVPYSFRVENTGNVTLTNVRVTDPRVPSLSCTFASLNVDQVQTCTGSYVVTQGDADTFAASNTLLSNTATVTADPPSGASLSETDTLDLPGSAPSPSISLNKVGLTGTYNAPGNSVDYRFDIRNTGNITLSSATASVWPPVVTDSLGFGVTCPNTTIAPGQTLTCSGTYLVQQSDIDDGEIVNTASTSFTVNGQSVTGSDTNTVPATRSTGIQMVKRLASGSLSTFTTVGQTISYEYEVRNTGSVTLNTVRVEDDKVAVSCPTTAVAPQGTLICTASYAVTQADLNAGNVVNLASGFATPSGDTSEIQSTQQNLTVNGQQTRALEIAKTAGTPTPAYTIGSTITYTFDVTNTGNVDLTGPFTVNDNKIGVFQCFTGTLLTGAGNAQSCTADYILTNADVSAGFVTNTATVSGDGATSPSDTATVANTARPSVALAKSASPSPVPAGTSSVTYTFTVTNDGDAQIVNDITINDPLVGPVDCTAFQPSPFNVGVSFSCTANYTIQQSEIDAGEIINTATASFPFSTPAGTQTITSPSVTAITPITENASFVFAKSVPPSFSTVGETLTYTFSIANDGNVALANVDITDPNIPSLNCTITDLAPAVTDNSCIGTYVVTQADVDAATIVNTASATGQTPQGTQVDETASATTTRTPTATDKQFSVDKSASLSAFATVGQDITYAIEVLNTGFQTIEDLVVTDILDPNYTCSISSIAPGQANDQCSFTHRVTQDDVDAGFVTNVASVVNPDFGPITDTLTINGPARAASITTSKVALNTFAVEGETVTYRVSVTNTGNVRINSISVEDRGQTCSTIGTLEPGVTDNSCEFTFTVSQADVDAGEITNTATTTGTGADGTPLTSPASTTASGPSEAAGITVVKVENTSDGVFTALPGTESYTITVQNSGNVTLNNVSVTDDLIGLSCTITTILPGDTETSCSTGVMTGTYTVLQEDIDRGSLTNTAQVSGTTPQGTVVTDEDEVVLAGPTQTRALETQKSSATLPASLTAVGDTIDYSYDVFNRGNTTMTSPITVTDDKIASVSCPALPIAGLAPNASITCTATYAITQADLDAGSVTNIASASSTSPNGTTVTSPVDDATVATTQTPAMTVDKRLKSSSAGTYNAVGDQVTYEYVVMNTGNVTISDTVRINDDRFVADLTCTATDIAPSGQVICEQTYTITQTDLNDGLVTNTAQAFTGATLGASPLTSNTDQVTVTAMQDSILFLDKTIVLDQSETFTENQVLNYTYLVRNDGNVAIAISAADAVQDNRTTVDCTGAPASIDPGASFTCTSTGTVTAGDILLGAHTNIAFAQGTFDGSPVLSPTDLQLFPVDAMPALAIDKTTSTATFSSITDTIVYTYAVTNTGNTDLGGPFTVTDDKFPGVLLDCPDPTSGSLFRRISVEPTEIATCTQTYTVTQADLDRGFVTNVAEANTVFGAGANAIPVVSQTDAVTVSGTVTAELDLTKTVSPLTPPQVNDVLTYTLTATASGEQTVSGAEISDPLVGALSCTQSGAAVLTADLDPNGDPLICTGTVTVTQQMIDDGVVTNTASVRGSAPDGTVITDDATNNLTAETPAPELTVTKTIDPEPISGADPAYATIDQTVEFIISVENTGNVTVDGIAVADTPTSVNAATLANCSIGTLAPGDTSSTCRVEVITTQAEIDAGSFDNTATATGTPASGGTVTGTNTINVLGPVIEREFAMSKVANTTSFAVAGEVITYTYTIGNTGNVTLFDQPSVVDDKIGTFDCGTFPAGGLLPTDVVDCTADYSITQDDVDAGFVTNNASVTSNEVPTPATATETVNANRTPALNFVKTPSITSDAAAGDVITYTYRVENTGNTRLTNLSVADAQTSSAGTNAVTLSNGALLQDNGTTGDSPDGTGAGTWGTLAPRDVITFTSTYAVTQADIDDGVDLSNTATITSNSPAGTTPPTGTQTVNVPTEPKSGELTVEKTITNSTGIMAGDTVSFEITVENSGNLTLDFPVLTDRLNRLDGSTVTPAPTPAFTGGNPSDLTKLNVDETFTYTFTHTLSQADIDAGGVSNSVTARADDPDGNQVSDISGNGTPGVDTQATVLQVPAMPAISTEKTITTSQTEVGETVIFEITATNDGNVTLNSVNITDELTRADGTVLALQSGPTFTSATLSSSAGTLVPGETATYVASYRLVQEDIDAGGIANQATAFGTPPVGGAVSDVSDNGNDTDGNTTNDKTTQDIPATPALSVAKQLAASEAGNYDTLNQQIAYEFVVTNEGNVTLAGPFSIADALIEGSNDDLSCPAGPIAPNDTLTCTGTYSVTQDDLDVGSVSNSATVSDGTTTSPIDTLTIPAIQRPSMSVVKTAEEVLPENFDVGLEVTYTYTVTNDGNTTIEDPITIDDNLIPNVTCDAFPTGGVAPLGTYVCEGTYTVTAADVDVREVTNIASASDGATTSPLVSETIPDAANPSLSITKTAAAGSTFSDVGDLINYTFDVTNDGTQAFAAEVRVIDTKIGGTAGVVCFTPDIANPSLSVGETVSCNFDYAVTQEDLDAGEVINEAFAQTSFDGGATPVSSAPTSETVSADLDPMMSLVKTSSPNPAGAVGSTVTYTFVATNTGNQTLNTVKVTDPRIPSLNCETPELLRGGVLNCSADYIVQQSDIDAGTLVNTASVNAMTPQGTSIPVTTASETTDVPASAPAVSVDKIASQTSFGEAGTFVTFLFDVRNLGNTTLSNITVDDVLDTGAPCVIPTLAPGDIDNFSCTFMLEVTQDMVDTATVTNTVDVTATDPFGTTVTDTDSETLTGPPRVPALETTKIVLSGDKTLFSPIIFALQVENTGNVTLSAPVITDTMTRLNTGASVSLTTPFALDSGDTDGDGLLDVGETFVYLAPRNLSQGDINAGGLSNTASATADGPIGTGSGTDVSDNGNDADGNTTDDPTIFSITSDPEITTIKSVVGTTGNSAGDTVTFSIIARNTGNVDVTGVTIVDTFQRADGTPLTAPGLTNVTGSTNLVVGDEIEWRLAYTMTQDDVDSGGLNNSANISGLAPNGAIVSDTSANDNPFDGNNVDDISPFVISPEPSLDVLKEFTQATVVPGEQIGFTITSLNDGNVTLTGLILTDTMTRADGTVLAVDSVTYGGASQDSAEGTLQPGESSVHTVLYTIVQADIDAGGVQNSAVLSGVAPNGASLMDVSRDGDPSDGNNTDDPTVVPLALVQSTQLTKSVSAPISLFPQVYQVTFTLEIKNDGNLPSTNLQVVDDLSDFIGTATIVRDNPFVFATRLSGLPGGGLNPSYDGEAVPELLDGTADLAPGQTATIEIDLVYSEEFGGTTGGNVFSSTSSQQQTQTVSNEVTVANNDTDGDGIPNDIETCGSADRDGDGVCDAEDFDPTGVFYCEDNGAILAGGQISVQGPSGTQVGVGSSNNINIVKDGADGQFMFFVSRPGTYRLQASYPPGTSPSTSRLSSGTLDATSLLPADPASLGGGELGATRILSDFTSDGNTFYTTFVFEPGDPFIINNNFPVQNCANTNGIIASKTADRSSAVFGESVNFTLNFVNNTNTDIIDANLVDLLPSGMLYTPDSAQVNGVAIEPTVTALKLNWPGITLAANNTTRVTLAVRVVANGSYGELVNRTFVENATGDILSNIATVKVRVEPEHVFDCSDIIGKVFDDRNGNGYQDGPTANQSGEGEPGLPGVRLATLNGILITTDEHGRYHVPCAELPKDIGSNFLLKLDTRTLPTGYRVTTENPRVVRVTAGKFAKLNFGASLSNVVDIDLTAAAFGTGNSEPSVQLVKGVEHLISRISSTPSVLRLSYILRDEDRKLANARLKAVEALLRDRWRGAGRYKLNVERSIKRVQ